MVWDCEVCTYQNENIEATECEMCTTQRPGNSKITRIPSSGGQQLTLFGAKAKHPSESSIVDLTGNDSSKVGNDPRGTAVSRKRKVPPVSRSAARSTSKSTSMEASDFFSAKKKHSNARHSFSVTTVPSSRRFNKQEVQNVLQNVFRLKELRYLQPQVVETALKQQSQLLVLATGGGKSLCYQLPACLLGGLTIVISPLIALMQDQVAALNSKGIPAALLSSNQTTKQNQAVLDRVLLPSKKNNDDNNSNNKQAKEKVLASSAPDKSGTDTLLTLLYITPESIQTERMRNILKQLYRSKRLSMFAVDEAHCLSSWGHDFRPAYRNLTWLRQEFPNVPCMACTATATPQVVQDIQTILHLKDAPLYKGSFDRPNIFYRVRYKDAHMLQTKYNNNTNGDGGGGALQDMIHWIVKQHRKHAHKEEKCSGIVYVHKREDTQLIANLLNRHASQLQKLNEKTNNDNTPDSLALRAEPYHAGLKKADRDRILEEWSTDRVQVAVATVAFGMGIDLAHVRYVVHWTMPKTVEGFYQESGRAGRDGLPSYSLLYFSQDDVRKFQFLIRMQQQNSKTASESSLERKLSGLEQMTKYCTTPSCRRNVLIQHFGGDAVECRQTCDYCRDPTKTKRAIESAMVVKDVLGSTGRRHHPNGKKNEWDGQWNGPHGESDFGMDDEDRIAEDWGDDGMIGDLRVTDSSSYLDHSGAETTNQKRSKTKGGFAKVSSILDKFEALEKSGGENGFVHFRAKTDERPSTSVKIPDHFLVKVESTAKPEPKPKELTSEDHAKKAEQLRKDLEKLKAEREARMKAFLAKRNASK